MRAFVTVGTTKFDELVQAADSPAFLEALAMKGYDTLSVQIGAGLYEPRFEHGREAGVQCSYFRFKPDLKREMRDADLIVSHAGAGSIMEGLSLGKALIVVVNDRLMHNHQEELAQALAQRSYVVAAYPSDVATALADADFAALQPYAAGKPEAFAVVVNQEMAGSSWG